MTNTVRARALKGSFNIFMEYSIFCQNNSSDFNDDLIDGDAANKVLKIIFIFFYASFNHSLLGKHK